MLLLSEFVETIAQYFWRILAIFVLVLGIAAFKLLTVPDEFEARTLLLYKLGRDYIYVPDITESGARAPDPGDLQLVINAEMQILNSQQLKREVLDQLGVANVFPDLAGVPKADYLALEALSSAISINLVTGSYVVELTVRHVDPEMASRIANILVDRYMERSTKIFSVEDPALLREQIAAAERRAGAVEQEIELLIGGRDILSYETDQSILIAEQTRLRQDLVALNASIAGLEEMSELILSELDSVDPMIVDQREYQPNPTVVSAKERQVVLEAQRRATAAQLGPAHPTVVALDREISALTEIVGEQPDEVLTIQRSAANPVYRQAQQEFFTARLQVAEHLSRRNFLVAKIEENAATIAEYAARAGMLDLTREKLRSQRDQIARLYARLQDREVNDSLTPDGRANIRIIEAATPPVEPVGPPKLLRLIIALMAGGVVALGWVMFKMLTRQTLLSASTAGDRLGLPVLGEVARRARRGRPEAGMA